MLGANDRIKGLIIKHLKEELTVEEQLELRAWVDLSDHNRNVFEQLTDPDTLNADLVEFHEAKINIWNKVNTQIRSTSSVAPSSPSIVRPLWPRIRIYVAAASLLIVFATSYFWLASLFQRPSKARPVSAPVAVQDVAPGGNKATLTLGNGATIVLENAADGRLAEQGASHVSKNKDQLAYKAAPGPSAEIIYNTLTTPRAGQFQVVLPDGTNVFLNNASSLRYPTSFSGATREVELTGEAYFDVAKNVSKPFSVKTSEATVHVLGTSFNVMAYNNESTVNTTLVTGAVKVAHASHQTLLAPGDQVQLDHNGDMKKLQVNVSTVIAWKTGFFNFSHTDFQGAMRQLARWYDIEVIYKGPAPTKSFTGMIDRTLKLSEVINIFESDQVHMTIDGKSLIVSSRN